MTRLILIRHGESEANVKEIGAGQLDYPLTELGKTQAELAARYLYANEKIDVIYSSDLQRAYHTARPIAELLRLPIIKEPRLREIDTGEWAGIPFAVRNEQFPELIRVLREDYSHMQFPGGESISDVYRRVVPCILELAEKHDGQTVLIASHAGALRTFLAFANGYAEDEVGNVRTGGENANIHIHEWDGKKIRVVLSYFSGHLGDTARYTAEEKKV